MNLLTLINAEVYIHERTVCIRFEKPNNEGPTYLPILPVSKGIELRRMEMNTKIASLTGELIGTDNEKYSSNIVVYSYLLCEELDLVRKSLPVIFKEGEFEGV